jgi:hypothetical protein
VLEELQTKLPMAIEASSWMSLAHLPQHSSSSKPNESTNVSAVTIPAWARRLTSDSVRPLQRQTYMAENSS